MITLKYAITCLILISTSLATFGQDKEEKAKVPFKDRLVYGGGLTLNFGNNFTLVGVSPTIGYKVTDRYVTGIGISYLYLGTNTQDVNSYATSIFNQFSVTKELYLHAEFEVGRSDYTFKAPGDDQKISLTYPALLVGAGYRQMAGGRVSIGFMVLYDVIQDPNSPYQSIIYRGGVMVGF